MMPTHSEIVKNIALAIQKVLDRHDNWGVTPYPMVAEAALQALLLSLPDERGSDPIYTIAFQARLYKQLLEMRK